GHHGGFFCPDCGDKRPEPQVSVTDILAMEPSHTRVRVQVFGENDTVTINLPGGYNIYNAVGALAVSEAAGFDRAIAKEAVECFACGFGRMEEFDLGGHSARIILVKNPAGCNQVLNYLAELSVKTVFICCLNDNSADGRDVSWIWDANFERISEMSDLIPEIYVAGIRSADMAVRLKYAGVDEHKLRVFDDYDELIGAMKSQPLPVIIMPTYTAMMDLRAKMSAAFGGKEFWE
ncbi:MAG: MurT ligase domain-containing protein, partial [Oscillospiraceae bacterium]|nr:MurT ligase domain-containing protein [Oscillospiraceae bacterium]